MSDGKEFAGNLPWEMVLRVINPSFLGRKKLRIFLIINIKWIKHMIEIN
jgi:hypothetical protein